VGKDNRCNAEQIGDGEISHRLELMAIMVVVKRRPEGDGRDQ
jgi:hypothetical protein